MSNMLYAGPFVTRSELNFYNPRWPPFRGRRKERENKLLGVKSIVYSYLCVCVDVCYKQLTQLSALVRFLTKIAILPAVKWVVHMLFHAARIDQAAIPLDLSSANRARVWASVRPRGGDRKLPCQIWCFSSPALVTTQLSLSQYKNAFLGVKSIGCSCVRHERPTLPKLSPSFFAPS